jgi:hypothetical protein
MDSQNQIAAFAAQTSMLLDASQFCCLDGFYRVRVALGARDYAVLRAPAACAVADAIADLVRVIDEAIQSKTETDLVRLIETLLTGDAPVVWTRLDAVLTPTVVRIVAPEYREVYGEDMLPALDGLDASQRIAALKRLPVSVIVRLIAGLGWLLKNSIARSREVSAARAPASSTSSGSPPTDRPSAPPHGRPSSTSANASANPTHGPHASTESQRK